jgi:hypothetical protein
LPQQQAEAVAKRRVGLGFTGLGDALVMLGLRYDTEAARAMASRISAAMRNAAYDASADLAAERGAFPLFNADLYLSGASFASRLPQPLKDKIRAQGLRNSHLLSIAPTGTISLAFADNDTGVTVQGTGTHLQTSLSDLQKLGVDAVHTDGSVNTVVVEMGHGLVAQPTVPVFDTEDHVTLNVTDGQLADVVASATALQAANIDELSVALNSAFGAKLTGTGVMNSALDAFQIELDVAFADNVVTLGMILDAADGVADPLSALHGHSLVTAMEAAGISGINIGAITEFQVLDSDLRALMDAGLISADGTADVTVSNADGSLDATLAQLAAVGADHVTTDAASLSVDLGLAVSSISQVQTALNDIVAQFEAQQGGVIGTPVFDGADMVNLHVAATLSTGSLDAAVTAKLGLLGIDDVLDSDGNSIKYPI